MRHLWDTLYARPQKESGNSVVKSYLVSTAGAGSAYREQSGVRPRYKVPKNKIFKWLSRESDPESGEGLEGPGGTRGASRRRGRRRRIRLLVAQRESHFTEWGYARLTFRKERA